MHFWTEVLQQVRARSARPMSQALDHDNSFLVSMSHLAEGLGIGHWSGLSSFCGTRATALHHPALAPRTFTGRQET